ncbi:hypothetical protein VHEMI09387 [[Torrubiella] hemipterigena]|uniref:Uncharacterized protein n=1 Tax=[Torrubiella] hemipterigena TaxID=1531966 RepID=A0A0A1TPY4_9HYPO|nr:hypothetical protein VHEMI09387 [[Torrubiella] hemipterigena]
MADYELTVAQVYAAAIRERIEELENLGPLAEVVHPRRLQDIKASPHYNPLEISGNRLDPELHVKGARLGLVAQVAGRHGLDGWEHFAFDRSWITFELCVHKKGSYRGGKISFILWDVLCMGKSVGNIINPDKHGTRPPIEQAHEFRMFLMLFILAEADSKIREHVVDTEMEAILTDLDTIAEWEGTESLAPTREPILENWNHELFNRARLIDTMLDVPRPEPDIPLGQPGRVVGNGSVIPTSFAAAGLQGFINSYKGWHGGRQLMTFIDNKWLGLGAVTVLPGDELWLIPGLGAPAILRPLPRDATEIGPHRYNFFGATYIYACMGFEEIIKDHVGEDYLGLEENTVP